jgi:hypothetical protein
MVVTLKWYQRFFVVNTTTVHTVLTILTSVLFRSATYFDPCLDHHQVVY